MNIENFLKTTSRRVTDTERNGVPVKVLHVSRSFPCTKESLWEMITVPEKLMKCFLPVSGDLRPGGRFQFEGNAGGKILTCKPHEQITTTWEMHGLETWLELYLEEVQDGVSLSLIHTASVPDYHGAQFGPGAVGIGWELGLAGLEKFILSNETFDCYASKGWAASDDGIALIHGSSRGWAEASIESGTAPEAAEAAATVVVGFYVGQQ